MGTSNYSATLNKTKLVHWPLMGGLLHLVQRGGYWAGPQPLLPLAKVTGHPSTASVHRIARICIMVRCSYVLICQLNG